jgi:hypothetical protein
MLNLPLHYNNQMYLTKFENDKFIKWHVFSTSDEYVEHIATFFQCVSLMTLPLK